MEAIMEYLLQHHREVPRAVPPLTRLIWEPDAHLCSISLINVKLHKQLDASPSQTHLFPAPFTNTPPTSPQPQAGWQNVPRCESVTRNAPSLSSDVAWTLPECCIMQGNCSASSRVFLLCSSVKRISQRVVEQIQIAEISDENVACKHRTRQ